LAGNVPRGENPQKARIIKELGLYGLKGTLAIFTIYLYN
jgi:hypothetical protein